MGSPYWTRGPGLQPQSRRATAAVAGNSVVVVDLFERIGVLRNEENVEAGERERGIKGKADD